jgi:hypothetical protein
VVTASTLKYEHDIKKINERNNLFFSSFFIISLNKVHNRLYRLAVEMGISWVYSAINLSSKGFSLGSLGRGASIFTTLPFLLIMM